MRTVIACLGEPLICFAAPSMFDARTVEISEGGAEFNVAVHLARLGLPVRFIGAVGDDVLGRRIAARLRREGVDVSALHVDADRHTGAHVKGDGVSYLRAGSAASRFVPPPAAFAGFTHLHLTGITPALSEDCADLVARLVARPRSYTVSFDVNYRAKLWPAEEAALCLARLTGAADHVFVGRDEAQHLWGTDTADDIRSVLTGPAELVVKDDAREAVAWVGEDRYALAPAPVEVVEPVGAGDAFAAGYLYARSRGYGPQQALAAGHRLAAAALRSSDDLGEPVPRDDLDRLLQGAP